MQIFPVILELVLIFADLLLPILIDFAEIIRRDLLPIILKMLDFLIPILEDLAPLFGDIMEMLKRLAPKIAVLLDKFLELAFVLIEDLMPVIMELGQLIIDNEELWDGLITLLILLVDILLLLTPIIKLLSLVLVGVIRGFNLLGQATGKLITDQLKPLGNALDWIIDKYIALIDLAIIEATILGIDTGDLKDIRRGLKDIRADIKDTIDIATDLEGADTTAYEASLGADDRYIDYQSRWDDMKTGMDEAAEDNPLTIPPMEQPETGDRVTTTQSGVPTSAMSTNILPDLGGYANILDPADYAMAGAGGQVIQHITVEKIEINIEGEVTEDPEELQRIIREAIAQAFEEGV